MSLIDDIDASTRMLENAKRAAQAAADLNKIATDLRNQKPRLEFDPAPKWLSLMEETVACMGTTQIGSIFIPTDKDGSHFLVCRIVAIGDECKVPKEATHVLLLRGQYPRGGLYVDQAIGHMLAQEDAVAGWFTRTEKAE